jgi:tRNA(Ile)-lysidine synthase
LLRIFRGAGQRGLSGMPPSNRQGIIRPLLECHRHEINNYLEHHGLACRQDQTNLKPWCQRNLLRLELLPRLRQEFNSNLNATLLRTSTIFRQEEEFWQELLQAWLKRHSHSQGDDNISLPLEQLLTTHPAMQKRLLRRVVEKVKGDLKGFGFHHTEILLELCRSVGANRRLDLPGGLQAEKNYHSLTVRRQLQPPGDFLYEISAIGFHLLPHLNHRMEVESLAAELPLEFSINPLEVIMDQDRVTFPLILRSSKPGDRFRPLGLGGSKKLKDLFIDAKVVRSQRRQVPILCSQDHIIWVVGHRLDDRVKITSHTTRLLRLRYVQDDGQE